MKAPQKKGRRRFGAHQNYAQFHQPVLELRESLRVALGLPEVMLHHLSRNQNLVDLAPKQPE